MLLSDGEWIDVRVSLPSRFLRLLSVVCVEYVCCYLMVNGSMRECLLSVVFCCTYMLLFDFEWIDVRVSLPRRYLRLLFAVICCICILLFDDEWIERIFA